MCDATASKVTSTIHPAAGTITTAKDTTGEPTLRTVTSSDGTTVLSLSDGKTMLTVNLGQSDAQWLRYNSAQRAPRR